MIPIFFLLNHDLFIKNKTKRIYKQELTDMALLPYEEKFTDDENIRKCRLGREGVLYENRKNIFMKGLYDDWTKEMLEKF